MQKLSYDFVAFPFVIHADASVAISPEWLISRELVIDRLVCFTFLLLIHFFGGIRHTNGFRNVLLKDELDMIATVAIINQATVETVQTVCSTEFHTDIADEQLDQKVKYHQHSCYYDVEAN